MFIETVRSGLSTCNWTYPAEHNSFFTSWKWKWWLIACTYIWPSPIIFSDLFTSENSFQRQENWFFLLQKRILGRKQVRTKYRRRSDVQATSIPLVFKTPKTVKDVLIWENRSINLENWIFQPLEGVFSAFITYLSNKLVVNKKYNCTLLHDIKHKVY